MIMCVEIGSCLSPECCPQILFLLCVHCFNRKFAEGTITFSSRSALVVCNKEREREREDAAFTFGSVSVDVSNSVGGAAWFGVGFWFEGT